MSDQAPSSIDVAPLAVADAHGINFAWLIHLRWWSIAGQAATILVVDRLLGIPLPLGALFAIVAFGIATNLLALGWARRFAPNEGVLAGFMLLDVVLLTALLYLTGGPFNPFSFLYLVQIALAAVVLRAGFTWLLVAASGIGSALLFLDHRELVMPAMSHDEHMQVHLRGMWVAFVVAASFTVYFLLRVRKALSRRDEQLASIRTLAARRDKLAALGTLAAGAAHELSTPLSTIALVAKELERQIDPSSLAMDDIRLVRAEVTRCRAILEQMATDAGQTSGEPIDTVSLSDLLERALAELGTEAPVSLELDEEARALSLRAPRRALSRAFLVLVKNAREASPEGAHVKARAYLSGDALHIEVEDQGTGMTPSVLARAGEPFFTTKPPGRGMGLGIFVSRAVIERMGGKLDFHSIPGQGTVASVRLPLRGEMTASWTLT